MKKVQPAKQRFQSERMIPRSHEQRARERLILAGLYLAKYDSRGLERLGFEGFSEAFNVLAYSAGARPASIKNYRDEFDPLFPNERKGWHKRPLRTHCREVLEKYGDLEFENFSALMTSVFGPAPPRLPKEQAAAPDSDSEGSFGKRLTTGIAAERYFERVFASIQTFQGYACENTTMEGCGFDFRLRSGGNPQFLAVEVKGLRGMTGCVSLTSKEHEMASALQDRFFLFVAKNFQHSPCHDLIRNPLESGLEFRKIERVQIQVSWNTSV